MKGKRILRNVVIVSIAVALLSYLTGTIRLYSMRPDSEYLFRVMSYLQKGDVNPYGLGQILSVGTPVRAGYWQVCVSELMPVQQGLACENSVHDNYVSGDELALLHLPFDRVVSAPNGSVYRIEFSAEIVPKWAQVTLVILLFGGALVAWTALAIWMFADARDRLAKAAPAWALISLLTGPVGLAVWLVVRGEQPSDLCPHCGTRRVPGTAYCVRCGQSLELRCPACGRPVAEGWAHCGTCGAALHDGNGGGGNRVLADEDRAG